MTTPCSGLWDLFDSTEIADHRQAKALCLTCPVLAACRAEAHELNRKQRTLSSSAGMQGTWGGRLYGESQRLATEDAMFTDGEARSAHAAWKGGDTTDRARIGERVYQRRAKRRQQARRRKQALRERG